MKKAEKLPVIIRSEGPDPRDVVAIFPTLPGTNDPRSMTCYSYIGQHGSCYSGYVGRCKKASKKQVAAMLKHLRSLGYKHLKVVSRPAPAHFKARVAEINR